MLVLQPGIAVPSAKPEIQTKWKNREKDRKNGETETDMK